MLKSKNLQILGIPYAALLSVIFGMMIVSFPIGAFMVFNSEIGNEINFDFPIKDFAFFIGWISNAIPFEVELGDAFIVVWCAFLVLFSIAILGPKANFLSVVMSLLSLGKNLTNSNYLTTVIKWFTVIIVISGAINFIQEGIDVSIVPPEPKNRLVQFYGISVAAISEEIVFRVLLIGVPVFFMYSRKASAKFFLKSLWSPSETLNISKYAKVLPLIVAVGIFFGISHVISGDPWSAGKISQAAASGIIIGWVYFRYGMLPAILIHWATNYFIFSYVFLVSYTNDISVQSAFSHSFITTLEILFVITGIISIAILAINYLGAKKEEKLKV
ncbi:MAG: CPBP family glutamic-type intramembrane protease [Nitrososphaerota archaeon]